jgi:uncharacterized membrane protein
MDTQLVTGIIFGAAGMFVLGGFMLVIIGLFIMLHNGKYNRLIRIKNITAGQPKVEWFKGRFIKHPILGDCYEVPKLRREQRQFIPFFGSNREYPTTKSRMMYVPVTFYKNVYAPEDYTWKEEVQLETIEKIGKKYEKVIKMVISPIITPLKSSMRQFNLAADKVIDDEFSIPIGWFERNKVAIMSFAMMFITAVVCIIMIIFAYQAVSEGNFSSIPEWGKQILDAVKSGQAPPPLAP